MVIDTSALISIQFDESDSTFFEKVLATEDEPLMSAASLLETSIVVEPKYPGIRQDALDLLIARFGIKIVSVSADQTGVARRAYRQFGRGRHKAGLDFGDCLSYALAKTTGEPLLFKGDDFGATDLSAIAPPPSPQNT